MIATEIGSYDFRDQQTDPPKRANRFRIRHGRVLHRDPSKITGITIHQTDCVFGAGPFRMRKAGGNRSLARARRAMEIPYHCLAFDGFYAIPHPLTWYTYHANRLSSFTLGFAVEGRYPEFADGRLWFRKQTQWTELRIETGRAGLLALYSEAMDQGMPIHKVFAHRQSNGAKPRDPSEVVWRAIVVDYAIKKLGLVPHYRFTVGSGIAVPRRWA